MYLVSEYCPVTMADFIVDSTQDTSLPVMSSIAVQVARVRSTYQRGSPSVNVHVLTPPAPGAGHELLAQ